ncbi:hypothetical protein GCM10009846_26740 [Agrococcus versicolor]|uniref:Uncharacterized protein n=1 Tax=Agrococcus versicolor TaxID=501482 RepID=A0ABN3AX87_9MICO
MDARGTPPPSGTQGEPAPWPPRAEPPHRADPPQHPGEPPPSPAYARPAAPAPSVAWPASTPAREAGPPPSPAYGSWPPPQHPTASSTPQPSPAVGQRTTIGRVLRVWWAGRLRRLVPRGVPWTAVALAVVLLAAWLLFADILLTPGVVMTYPGDVPSRAWAHDVVGWVALMTTFGLGFASATMLLQVGRPRWRWASVALTVLSSAVTLGLVTSGPGQAIGWVAGIAGAGLAASTLAVLAALLSRQRVHLAVAAAFALAIQWGLVTWVGAIEPFEWVFLTSWTNLAFPVLVAIGAIAILAVAVYAQQVHARADRIGRRVLLASWVPIAAAAIALAVVALRMGPLSTLFGDVDANLWGIGPPSSWPHALLVGGLVVWLVARSGRRPLRPRGHVLTIVVLSIMAGMAYLSFFVTYLLMRLLSTSPEIGDAVGAALSTNATLLTLLASTLLLLPILLPAFRRTTGRVGAIVALAVAVPLQLWMLASLDLGLPWPRFAASPSQIAAVVLVAVLGLAIWGAVRRRDVVDRHLLLRLALVPVLTMHAGQLLPGVWRDDYEQALVVVLSLAGLLLLGAPRTGTKEGDARAIVAPFAVQMAVLGSVIVARTLGALADDESTTISVLYLTIPVATVLCCRLEDASDAWRLQASTIDLQTMRRARGPVAVGQPASQQPASQPLTAHDAARRAPSPHPGLPT